MSDDEKDLPVLQVREEIEFTVDEQLLVDGNRSSRAGTGCSCRTARRCPC